MQGSQLFLGFGINSQSRCHGVCWLCEYNNDNATIYQPDVKNASTATRFLG